MSSYANPSKMQSMPILPFEASKSNSEDSRSESNRTNRTNRTNSTTRGIGDYLGTSLKMLRDSFHSQSLH